jgi:hypothetical protein
MVYISAIAVKIALAGANFRALMFRRSVIALPQVATKLPAVMLNLLPVARHVTVIAANVLPVAITIAPAVLGHSSPHTQNADHQ